MPPAKIGTTASVSRPSEWPWARFEKQFGKGSIMRLGQKDAGYTIPAISTGSVSLDFALGIGGVPRGRVIEIFGPDLRARRH